jgi:hypothetical protein
LPTKRRSKSTATRTTEEIKMTLEEKIIDILENSITARVHFRCDGVNVWGEGYKIIADKIRSRAILCMENTRLPAGVAFYSAEPNKLSVSTEMANGMTSATEKALIVHEATHALEDRAARPMNLIDSECPAFIAQCMYLKIAMPNQFPFQAGPHVNIFAIAHDIASMMLRPGGNRTLMATSVELQSLKEAITACPLYHPSKDEIREFDGIAEV